MATTTPIAEAPIAEAPPSGKSSSEFIAVALTHALAFLISILDLLNVHWSHGISALQAAIPLASVAISALLTSIYGANRTKLKVAHVNQAARSYMTAIEANAAPVLHDLEGIYAQAGPLLPPKVQKEVQQVAEAVQKVADDVAPGLGASQAP